jgi:DNA-directed RNA polymerase specialized sigma24 family protein
MIVDQARAAIAKSNAQITAASAAVSDPALTTTNQALDENNDQNAQLIALIQNLPAQIRQAFIASGGTTLNLAELARTS